MSTIESSIEVQVPVRTAYDQWTQFESFPKFMLGVDSVTQLDDTHLHWVADIAGVRREWSRTPTSAAKLRPLSHHGEARRSRHRAPREGN